MPERFRLTRLTLASIALFFLSFPPFRTGILAYGALIPLFMILEDQPLRSAFRLSYLTGLATLAVLLYWLNWNSGASQIQATSMYLGTILYLACWWGLYGVLQTWINVRMGRNGFLAAPFLWTSIDYLQSLGELGFTWHSLATTQTFYTPIVQFIEWTGMYGLTFWIVSINTLLYLMWRSEVVQLRRRSWYLTFAAVLLMPALYGILRLQYISISGRQMNVAIIQPNIEPNRKWLERDFAFTEVMRLTDSLPANGIDLVLWPETAIPNRIPADEGKYVEIRELLTRKRTELLTGIPHREKVIINQRASYHYFNSVYVIGPETDSIQIYHKNHLVPFGEFVPSFLAPLKDMAMSIGVPDYESGRAIRVLNVHLRRDGQIVDSVFVGAAICLESVFPQLVREQVRLGARLIAIVTNDAWYDGTFGPIQHAQIAVLRAVENRVPVIRSANSGISNVVDQTGQVMSSTQNGVQDVLTASISVPRTASFYTKTGDWFPVLCFIGMFLFIVFGAIFPIRASP